MNSISASFDWNAYEKSVLKQHNPTFFDNSTRMRTIAGTMVACAGALAHYAIRAKLTITPSILVGSAVVAIVFLAVRIFSIQSYTDQKIHKFIISFRSYLDKAVQEKKGLKAILNEMPSLETKKKIVWAHIKHYELTLSYAEIQNRNGDIEGLLNDAEKKALGSKFINELSINSHARTTISIAKSLLVLDLLAQAKIFKDILLETFKFAPISTDQISVYEYAKTNNLLSKDTIDLFEYFIKTMRVIKQAHEESTKALKADCANKRKDQAENYKQRLGVLNQQNQNAQLAQLDELALLQRRKVALEAIPEDKKTQLTAAEEELAELTEKLTSYNTLLTNQQQIIQDLSSKLDALAASEIPGFSRTISSKKEIDREYNMISLLYDKDKEKIEYKARVAKYEADMKKYDQASPELRAFVDADVNEQFRINGELAAKHSAAINTLVQQIEKYKSLPQLIESTQVAKSNKQNEINLLQQEVDQLIDKNAIAALQASINEKTALLEKQKAEHQTKLQELQSANTLALDAITRQATAQQTSIDKVRNEQEQNAYAHYQKNINDALLKK